MESFKPILYKAIKIVFITGLLVRFFTTVFVSVRSCQLSITVRWRTSSWYFYPACLASLLTRWGWRRVPTQSLCLRLPSPSVPTTRASKLSVCYLDRTVVFVALVGGTQLHGNSSRNSVVRRIWKVRQSIHIWQITVWHITSELRYCWLREREHLLSQLQRVAEQV